MTENFTLEELTRSDTATRLGIDNTPSPEHRENLLTLARLLEVVRAGMGNSPIRVTSGYRSPKVNSAIGGSTSSDHCKGLAADFTVKGKSNLEVCKWIEKALHFRQLIYEFGEEGWIHLSAGEGNQVLTARKVGGRTVYLPGLV